MNDIKIFEHEKFGKIRVMVIENQEWFVGKDVAEILEYKEPNKAIAKHIEEDDRTKHPITDSSERIQQMWMINESGL